MPSLGAEDIKGLASVSRCFLFISTGFHFTIYITTLEMTLTVSVIPASSQAGRAAISALLKDERRPVVNAIYRDISKAPAEFLEHPRFNAIQGNVAAHSGLHFGDSDAVFYIPPPTYDGSDTGEFATANANNVKAAVKNAPKVKRLVVFSGLGSQNEKGIVGISFDCLRWRMLTNLGYNNT
jgi:hypothetical protein